VLEQSLALYDTYQIKIAECNLRLEYHLKRMESKTTVEQQPAPKASNARSHRKQMPGMDMGSQLYRIAGVDLTQIDGIQVQTAQTVISEVGVDMSRWRTEKQFASWLGLCPDNRISGGKVLKRGTRHVVNRAATALRMAAWSLFRSRSALGANFRRLRRKLGAPKAVTAMAHKLARLVYRMLKFGQGYVDKGMEHYEAKYRQDQIKWLAKSAAALNLQLTPLAEVVD
jgi:transposase